MPYVFGTLPTPTPEDTFLEDTMQGYWTRFARTGDPNGDDALAWPAFDGATYTMMRFDGVSDVVSDFRRDECALWASVYQGESQ